MTIIILQSKFSAPEQLPTLYSPGKVKGISYNRIDTTLIGSDEHGVEMNKHTQDTRNLIEIQTEKQECFKKYMQSSSLSFLLILSKHRLQKYKQSWYFHKKRNSLKVPIQVKSNWSNQ